MDIFQNFDLLSVGFTIAAIAVIGFVIYFHNRKSITNESFLLFAITTICWSTTNYLNYSVTDPTIAFALIKLTVFFATYHAFTFFQLLYTFPNEHVVFPKWYKYFLEPLVVLVSFITLTPLVFKNIESLTETGRIDTVTNGPLIPLFGITALGLIIAAIVVFIRKMKRAEGLQKKQFQTILIGTIITFSLLLTFNFVLPSVLNISNYVSLGALFIFPFIVFTSYAIFKQGLFNIKITATATLIFVLSMVTLFEVIYSKDIVSILFRSGQFILVLAFGILLIKGVMREIEQKDKLKKLSEDLEQANEKLKGLDKLKTEFLSLASHQLRSPLTAIKGYASMLLENSFGPLTDEKQREAVDRIFQSSMSLAKTVEDLLNVSKIEQGGMKYEMMEMDVAKLAEEITNELSISAKNKNLELTFSTDNKKPYLISGDSNKLRQVFVNFIDNSIKYTKEGFIKVMVSKSDDAKKIVFSVTDSGMGMTPEIKAQLFQKFSRGEGARMNTGGSGLGLYLAKEIVEAHKGTVDVTSPGMGQGSTFSVELISL